jgi:hypothetical protein
MRSSLSIVTRSDPDIHPWAPFHPILAKVVIDLRPTGDRLLQNQVTHGSQGPQQDDERQNPALSGSLHNGLSSFPYISVPDDPSRVIPNVHAYCDNIQFDGLIAHS